MAAIDSAEVPGTRASVLPYAGTIFLSAFLLFLVQPIIAKQILPWFGGSSAVWTTALVFFQSTLLAGYASEGKESEWSALLAPALIAMPARPNAARSSPAAVSHALRVSSSRGSSRNLNTPTI